MKRFITFMIAACLCANAFAQFSVGAGYMRTLTRETMTGREKVRKYNTNGAYAGVGYTFKLRNDWGITPGVYYSFAYDDETWMQGLVDGQGSLKEHYINIPVHFSKSWDDFFVYLGPTFEVGLASNYTDKTSIAGSTIAKTKINYYDGNHYYSRFNVMLGVGVGYTFLDSIRVSAGFDYGFLDRSTTSYNAIQENLFHVGVAYVF